MSCFAKIKSPLSGNDVTSVAYYQTTTFFPPEVGRKIYEATTTTAFKVDLGFDWTKKQIGYSSRLNKHGEPTMEEMNSILNLKLTQRQLDAAGEIEEFANQGYLNVGFENPQAFELIEGEINLNPKYENVESEITVRDGKYYINVKPRATGDKVQKPVNKQFLKRVGFTPLLINSVKEFSNANLSELMDSLIQSTEIEEFQREMLKRLRRLMKVNPTLKLTVFDDTVVDENFQRSFYDPSTNTVYIGKTLSSKFGDKELVRDLIHEAVHAYTISAINNPKTTQELQFKNEMVKLYETYRDTFKLVQNWYGLQNVEEFVAEFVSNPYFRENLKDAEEGTTRNQNFFLRAITSIRNFFSSIFSGVVDRNTTMFAQVEKTLDDYLSYLEELGDMPDHFAEHHIRFNSTYQGRQARQIGQRTPLFNKFYNFVEGTISSSSWKQLAQSINELDPRMRSIERLKEKYGNLSIPSVKGTLSDTVGYLESMGKIVDSLQRDIDGFGRMSQEFTAEELVKIYNNAKLVSELFQEQLEGIEKLILGELDITMFKEEYDEPGKAQEYALKLEEIRRQIPNANTLTEELRITIKQTIEKVNRLNRDAKNTLVKASAAQMVPIFKKMIEDQSKEDSQLNQEIKAIDAEIAILKQQQQSNVYQKTKGEAVLQKIGIDTKLQDLQKRKKQLEKFKSFIPTASNIEKLFTDATYSGVFDRSMIANFFIRYMSVANMTGKPMLDMMKQFIDVHVMEAENESMKTRARIQALHERITNFNKKRGILNRFGSFAGFYEGFTREVDMDYYDENGNKTTIRQFAYQTRFKEAEFHNDLMAYKASLDKARKSGDEVLIKEAEDAFNKFVEDYAVRPYTDEYYEAEALLTEDARNARQEIFDEISSLEDVLIDEDFFDDGTVTLQNTRKQLLRDLESLGSIYNKDGSEKPVGSKEREIADSIIAYKKSRKELEINEYVIPENILKKFIAKRNELKTKFEEATNALNLVQAELNKAITEEQPTRALQEARDKAAQNLEAIKKERQKWLDDNTRTEIDPKFFEKQRIIAEKIKNILAKYGQEARVPELYEEIFSTARGYRDKDGIVVGSDMSEGLVKKINQLETELEALKKKAKDNRQITKEDKDELKLLFRRLNEIQTRENTQYYHDTVKEIKYQIESNIRADATRTEQLKEEARRRVMRFQETQDKQELEGITIDNVDEFFSQDFGTAPTLMHPEALINQMFDKLIQGEVTKDYFNSDWYKNNHITIDKSYVNESTGEYVYNVETRPIYVWVKTVPKDTRYIKQESPSFTWYVTRVRDAYKTKDARFMGEFRPRETADRKYINEEYEKIERGQPELKELIDEMVSIYESQQRLLPSSQRNKGYTVINQGRSGKERTYDAITRPFYQRYTIMDSLKLIIKPNIPGTGAEEIQEIEEDIESANKILKQKGKLVRLVKTRFKQPLNFRQVSADLLGSLSNFSVYTAEFKGLQKAMPVVFGLRDIAAENVTGTIEEDGKSVQVSRQNEIKMMDDVIHRFFYGEEMSNRGVSSLREGKVKVLLQQLNRIFSKMFRFTQFRVLFSNLLRWPKNITTNILRAMLNAKKFGVRRRDVLWGAMKGYFNYATMLSLHSGNKTMNKEAMLMTYFRAIPSADPTRQSGKIHQHGIFKYLNMEFFNDATSGYLEGASTRGIYEAIMNQTRIPITKNGVTTYVKAKDAYEIIDNMLVPKDGVFGIEMDAMRQLIIQRKANLQQFLASNGVATREELPGKGRIAYDNLLKAEDGKIAALEKSNKPKIEKLKNLEQNIRDQIHQMYTSTQGNYFKRSRSQYETSLFMSILLSMKRWLVPSLQNNYGQRRFNVRDGNVDQGFLNYTFFDYIWRKTKYLLSGRRMSIGSTAHERERIFRTGYDTALVLGLGAISSTMMSIAISAMRGLGGGDDDETMIMILSLLAVISFGIYDEYTSVHPVALYNFGVKTFKKKPLEKYGANETVVESVLRHGITGAIGQQARSFSDAWKAFEILADYDKSIFEPYYEQVGDKRQLKEKALFEGQSRAKVAMFQLLGFNVGAKPFSSAEAMSERLLNIAKYGTLAGVPDPMGELVVVDRKITELKDEILDRNLGLMQELAEIEREDMKKTRKGLKVTKEGGKDFVDKFMETHKGKVLLKDFVNILALEKIKQQMIVNNPILLKKEREKSTSQYQSRMDAETIEKLAKSLFDKKKGVGEIPKGPGYEEMKAREKFYQNEMVKRLKLESEKNKDVVKKVINSIKVTETGDWEFDNDVQYEYFK